VDAVDKGGEVGARTRRAGRGEVASAFAGSMQAVDLGGDGRGGATTGPGGVNVGHGAHQAMAGGSDQVQYQHQPLPEIGGHQHQPVTQPPGQQGGAQVSLQSGVAKVVDPLTGKKERKVRNVWAVPFYRESEKNRLLLDEVLRQNPFSAKFGKVKAMWDSISAELNKKDAFHKSQCDHQGCQNQVKKLVDYWERRRTVQAQLQNKLSEWEKVMEKMIEAKNQSEYQKNIRKTPVVSFEEEMLIYNQGGSLNKRPRFELNNGGVLEPTLDNLHPSNTELMKLLKEHSDKLAAIEVTVNTLKDVQSKVVSILAEREA